MKKLLLVVLILSQVMVRGQTPEVVTVSPGILFYGVRVPVPADSLTVGVGPYFYKLSRTIGINLRYQNNRFQQFNGSVWKDLANTDELGGGGTVVGYSVQLMAANASTTTDGQTIHFGIPQVAPSTTGGNQRVYIPKSGTIKAAYVYANAGTAGTGEAWVMHVRLNNTTDTQIQSLSLANANRVWSNTGLSIAVVAGDFIEIKSVNPTWATNPANVRLNATIYIE